MAEFIDREEVLSGLAGILNTAPMLYIGGLGVAFDCVRSIPAADVAPVRHGRWNFYDSFALECSNCGWINYHNMGVPNAFNYCPNCGADTRGEQDV